MNDSTNFSLFLYNKYDDISSLELTVKNHPVSSIARFLLLKQYQKNNDPRLEDYAAQTALYFNDPQWLSFQLLRTETDETDENSEQEDLNEEQSKVGLQENPELSEKNNAESLSAEAPDVKLEKTESDTTTGIDLTQNKIESVENGISQPIENNEQVPVIQLESYNKDAAPCVESEVGKTLVKKAEEEELIFEPLHTTDYFASQGVTIKESLMKDKLGVQMRSFSEWLKSMKQLHPGKLPEQNEVIERIIQSASEQSNVESEVLTEAMAEVLLKQNKQQKAIEMYEKLSLMNPSKSIYFAAKIDKIKNK